MSKSINEEKIVFETIEISGFKTAFKGVRNPLDSWEKGDSYVNEEGNFVIGDNDLGLAQRLISAGDEHAKFLRQIYVGLNANLPRYVWSEFDTYGFCPKNSCSTMHTLLSKKKPLTLDMFVYDDEDRPNYLMDIAAINTIAMQYRGELDMPEGSTKLTLKRRAKQLLPEGFLQLRTVATNYAVLRHMYFQRRNHQLPEWNTKFVNWVKTLPYATELIMYEGV